MSAGARKEGWLSGVWDLYRYVWRASGRAQLLMSVLAIGVFLLELAPLELQRRIVNLAVEQRGYQTIVLLCGLYLLVVLTQGGLKLTLNIYRGSVIETISQRLRLDPNLMAVARSEKEGKAEDQGVAISIVTSEVDAVGGFVGTAFSEPVLNGGILLSVFGYMLFMQPLMALVALALFVPQIFSSRSCRERSTGVPPSGSRRCARSQWTLSTGATVKPSSAKRPTGAAFATSIGSTCRSTAASSA